MQGRDVHLMKMANDLPLCWEPLIIPPYDQEGKGYLQNISAYCFIESIAKSYKQK